MNTERENTMERKNITAADATRFPRLYRGTYWGAFKLDLNADVITAEIIENRNRFAERWKLRRRVDAVHRYPAREVGTDFDHAETYTDAEGWVVLVVSNYGSIPPPAVLDLIPIPPVYSTAADSYAGRFASVRELRARLDACGDAGSPFAVRLDAGRGNAGGTVRGASRGHRADTPRQRYFRRLSVLSPSKRHWRDID